MRRPPLLGIAIGVLALLGLGATIAFFVFTHEIDLVTDTHLLVYNLNGGAPVPNAAVTVVTDDEPSKPISLTTDAAGRVALPRRRARRFPRGQGAANPTTAPQTITISVAALDVTKSFPGGARAMQIAIDTQAKSMVRLAFIYQQDASRDDHGVSARAAKKVEKLAASQVFLTAAALDPKDDVLLGHRIGNVAEQNGMRGCRPAQAPNLVFCTIETEEDSYLNVTLDR